VVDRRAVIDGLVAGAVAGVVSGLPSTVAALRHRSGPLAATRAAGTLLGRPSVSAGTVVHTALSLGWGVALSVVWPGPAVRAATGTLREAAPAARTPGGGVPIPAARAALWGMVAGAAIAAVDLGVVGRRLPAIRALPALPQWLDHLAFGAVVGWVLVVRAAGRTDSPGLLVTSQDLILKEFLL